MRDRRTGGGEFSEAAGIPRTVWVLGFVSMFMDISSEMIHALLPVFLVSVLGVSALAVGAIEGIAEATASITKVLSGGLSDRVRNRKTLVALGYGMAALTRPVFPLASTVGWVVAARFVDRVGKGIRGAPRDALIADVTAPAFRGASFGLRQSLDTVGAFVGPLAAMALMIATNDDYMLVFWIAALPALVSFALVLFVVREPEKHGHTDRPPMKLGEFLRLGTTFWLIAGVASVFTLARISEAFLILRAQGLGMKVALVPLVLVVMNFAYALGAYPAGAVSDRLGRVGLLAAGMVVLIGANITLALAQSIPIVLAGAAIWGLHMALTQGVLSAMIADVAPAHLRGTAFGVFNLATGVALLLASAIAGGVWEWLGAEWTFFTGAGFTVLALAGLIPVRAFLHSAARAS
jgi:MFS family permease